MTSNQLRVTHQNSNRFLNHHILFKKNSNAQRLLPFESQANNAQLYRMTLQENPVFGAPTPTSSSDKSHLNANVVPSGWNRKGVKIAVNDNATFLNDSLEKQRKSPLKRALSSNRFDLLTAKQAKRKGKKLTPNIFEYAKVLKKQSNSKKSTDQSSQTPVQSLKAQNQQYRQRIRQQQARMRKLQLAIAEQKKKHALQKHLYKTNIQKLKKIVGVNTFLNLEEEDSGLTMIDDEGYDTLSIESN